MTDKNRTWLTRLAALLSREPQNREQLTEILRDAEERDVLSTEILSMIESVLQVSEMQVREVMIPKAQMVVVQKVQTLKEILPIVIESGHSRFPVVDASKKDVIGMLLAKDLLKCHFQHANNHFNMESILRPVAFVPQSKRLDILLREFRVTRNHLAIVLDEYGHVAGLVTIEDVLEQIVGDIADEYDIGEEDDHIKKLDDDFYIVKANTSIGEFNEYFNAHFGKEFDTMGTILLQHVGHVPKRGESIKLQQFRFKILHSDNQKIYSMEVKRSKTKKKE